MNKQRKLYIHGQINGESFSKFSQELDTLLYKHPKAPIHIELVSEGGVAYDALSFYGRIRTCNAPIHITAYGLCHSAATLVLAAGDIRYCSSETNFMVHQSKSKISGQLYTLKALVEQEDAEEAAWCKLLSKRTDTHPDMWEQLQLNTSYFGAERAKNLGLIHEILKEKP